MENICKKKLRKLITCCVAPLFMTHVVLKDEEDLTFKTLCLVLGGGLLEWGLDCATRESFTLLISSKFLKWFV